MENDERLNDDDYARTAIERAIWAWGIQGDSCALLATQVMESVIAAGLRFASEDERT